MNLVPIVIIRSIILVLVLSVTALCLLWLPRVIVESFEAALFERILLLSVFFCMYAAAIPFYIAARAVWILLNLINRHKIFSLKSSGLLHKIKVCALVNGALYGAILPVLYVLAEADDAPGLLLFGIILSGSGFAVAALAATLQQLLITVATMKSEQELTV
jgi:hypothetical protein